MNVGKVYLVGAGPGDPGLITVKGMDLLRRADVVVHDRLIPHELLRECRADAEIIDAGKAQHDHRIPQPQINALLVEKARAGKLVVRLKGGDPFVFGRGGEEALFCHAAGVPFEVVPGVSSAIAAPAYAGIPVTDRALASAFTVFTGHENPNKPESAVDYPAIAAAARAGTLVLLMGVTYLPQIIAELLKAGIDGAKPAACIESGTTPDQRVIVGTVDTIVGLAQVAQVGSPTLFVIGDVVNLRAQGLDWQTP
ncbi:MAG: uroporphyrinogen-III C-methyltransferase [Chloroflexi bacterium]|uniref:uroporphyrinogen-III C-methyltransferase n=1 Tax=Candidatus Flexifilum breve TaxID=3140694 RepID=UPI003134B8FD|nr:uroporphyrinogen-III C-methyltransferase [Chloroflexota bacterium]